MKHRDKTSTNFYSAVAVDRLGLRRSDREWLDRALDAPTAVYLPVWRMKNLVTDGQTPRPVFLRSKDLQDLLPLADSLSLLGEKDGVIFFAVDLPANGAQPPTQLVNMGCFMDLRRVGPLLDHDEAALLAYARAITYWHGQNRFCGVCGAETKSDQAGHIRVCANPRCAKEHFPRTDPAIIVLVSRSDRCLLGRQPHWPEKMYSTIAGFVEPGESLEDAVAREVREETGVRIAGVSYHSSQPWPFPCSIMLGFHGHAADEEIVIGDNELQDARWFSRDEIVQGLTDGGLKLPSPISIAFRLIADWFAEDRAESLMSYCRVEGVRTGLK